ncbi:HAD-IA family hydrolase [Sulfitobacter sp. F26204]|uniref:HAD-IA family hydrolase n=1 Tax=Sulfitobacter sp. F26204 TaxID=2996014 RepID=UPI00225E4285|nr:HAD-IA family hydrolase [Sulfitobacter sp. F26204]MCX7559406.1 HAD-IA family hydrolase [Sulfitobacter sp. F26204]
MAKTVIFDLDGTLADTSADLIAAANVCFRDMGAGDMLETGRDSGIALLGARALLQLGLQRLERGGDLAAIDRYYPFFLDAYARDIDRHTVLYDGAMAAVEKLKAEGYLVAICTNKPEGLADSLLTRLGVRSVFDALLGADSIAVRKPDPEHLFETARRAGGDPARCILIGDSETDRMTARAAKVPCVLVTFGPSGEDMSVLQPEALLDHFDDLHGIVAQLIGTAA